MKTSTKIIIGSFVVLFVVLVATTTFAQTSVNTVVSAIWKRYATDLYTSPATLDISIGTTTQYGKTDVIDKLFVAGRINSSWTEEQCTANSRVTQLTGDTESLCPGFYLVEDAAGVADATVDSPASGSYWRLRPGSAGTAAAAGDGIGIAFGAASLRSASTSMSLETIARQGAIQNATSTLTLIGFATTTGASSDYAILPGGCMFVASSTRPNWQAVCSVGTTTSSLVYQQVDTGIASSSVLTGTGSFSRFRVDIVRNTAQFFIQSTSTDFALVATITSDTAVPTTTPMTPIAATSRFTTAGSSNELHVRLLKVWYEDRIWQ